MQLSVQQLLLSARKHAKNGQIAEAKKQYLSVLMKFPNNKPAQLGLAALNALHEPRTAASAQDQIKAVVELYNQGRLHEVIERGNALLKQYPQTPFLHNLLGVAYIKQGQIDPATQCFNRALQIDPKSVQAYNNLGGALKQSGNLSAAIKCYQKALNIEPDNAALHNNLAIALNGNGEIEAAEQSFQHALQIDPNDLKFITSLCDFYEKTNNLAGLSRTLVEAKSSPTASNANILYYAALLEFREKNFEQAKILIAQITPDNLIQKRVIAFYELKGKTCDKIGLFDDAYSAFSMMNTKAKQSSDYIQADPDAYFANITSALQELKDAPALPHVADNTDTTQNTPCFLVGFPRSGTTLLDTILRSHTNIVVAEEQPMVAAIRNELDSFFNLEDIESIDPKRASYLQAQYYAELDKHIENRTSNQVCIDKLPLNAIETPLIHSVFPHSKFILAIRHPYDCILSCYMQYFKLNPQMANMVDLERIIDFYCAVMETWWLSQKRYDLIFHMIRYEDLVVDMPNEIEKLLQFLGLEWQESLNEYQKTAIERGKINTPSYSQVVQPLYKDATYRWKNYLTYFSAYNGRVQPWIERFGYE